jgi:hypothetical protein
MPISFIDKVFALQVWGRFFVPRFSPKVPTSSKFLIHHHCDVSPEILAQKYEVKFDVKYEIQN